MGRHEVGAELRAALEGRGCALSAREARALSVLLIDLIADGLLTPDPCGPDSPTAYNMGLSNHQDSES